MRRLSLFSAILGLLATFSSVANAQHGGAAGATNTVSLTGTVYSEGQSRAVSQATVQLCDSGGTQIAVTMTNDSGEFFFRYIDRNTYILKIDANGFQSQEIHVDLSFTSDRGMSVFLMPNAAPASVASPASAVSTHEMSMPQKARDLMASGMKKIYQDKDSNGGLADLERATEIAPGYYEAYYQMAMAYLASNQNDDAEEAFQKSIQISGDKYGEAEVGLGTMLLNQGDNAGGEKDIRHGIELSPNFWFGYYELGRALLNDKQVAGAEKAGLQARSLAPGAPLVYRLLAIVHMDEKNYPALLDDLDQYIKLDPDSPAGQRAKELRSQVAQKVGDQKQNPTASPIN
jgi:tetratricopeptide (TPR) repeat protein